MRSLRALGATLALASAALLAGCGGGGPKATLPAGADVVPEDVAAFVSVVTDLQAPQFRRAEVLLARFPGGRELLASGERELAKKGVDFSRDVKPALGRELDFVWLDFANEGHNVVALTRPRNQAKLDALLEKGDNPPAHELVDGWTVVARKEATVERFKELKAGGGSLARSGDFQHALENLSEGALARAYVNGDSIQRQIEEAAAQNPATGFSVSQLPRVDSFGAALTAQTGGVSFDAAVRGDLKVENSSLRPQLAGELPAGALAYLGFSNLEDSMRGVIDRLGETVPNFDQRRAQIEAAIGVSLDDDVLPLFGGEGALAVYPAKGRKIPAIAFVQKVSDEDKARRVIGRLTALGQLGASTRVRTVSIGGVRATEIAADTGNAVYVAELGGKIVVTNSRTTIEDMQGAGPRLSGDPAFRAAATRLPDDETGGFLYANAHEGLRYVFDAVRRHGGSIPREALENTEPLRGLLLYSTQEGDEFRISGFLGIE